MIDTEDLQLIYKLYAQQRANIIVEGESTKRTCAIERGVRQGCPLSPRLFNVYAEEISKTRAFQNMGFKVNGEKINSICYADDRVLIAAMPNQLQLMITKLNEAGKQYGMKINASKTKVMQIGSTEGSRPLRIEVDGVWLEQVTKYKYLGVVITEDGRDDEEIKTRLGIARTAFNNLEKVLRDRKMKMELRIKILKCYVWSIARYAAETWIISKNTERRVHDIQKNQQNQVDGVDSK